MGGGGWWSGNANLGHHIVLLDLLHRVEALGDLAKDGVDAVEVLGVRLAQYHEELAATGVFARVRHRQGTDLVGVGISFGLALDRPSRSPCPDLAIAGRKIAPQRIAALNDEVVDHAMEFHAVVEPGVRELLEVGDGARSFLVEEIRLDVAVSGLEGGFLCHGQKVISSAAVFSSSWAAAPASFRGVKCPGYTAAAPCSRRPRPARRSTLRRQSSRSSRARGDSS